MSLDVHLNIPGVKNSKSSSGIFIRENGQTVEISKDEWDKRHPGQQPVMLQPEEIESDEVYHDNITHNLTKMADEAGIYNALWRPDEIGITTAKELIGVLGLGLDVLNSDPGHFKKFNPENGWGNYEGLVRFVSDYLTACMDFPEAIVSVSR